VLRGAPAQGERLRDELPVVFVPVDEDLALQAAMMAAITGPLGLSLGDRICLALARRSGLPALTADRSWLDIAAALGVTVEAIR
jgi:ribonuclease VapC